MARIRSLKPEFWTDSKVINLQNPWARLLFMGTWNFAICDAGHLEDDALSLKLKILPAENLDAHALLEEVLASGMLSRGSLPDGTTYLVIGQLPRHSKVDPRWSPRCHICARLSLAHPTETPVSMAETPGVLPFPAQESLVDGLVEELSSSTSADAEANQEDESPPDPKRLDVEFLCRLLRELIIANGSRRPNVTKAWRDDARRLLDNDRRSIVEVEKVMRWALADSFWRPNIGGMPKFRKQYDQLRLKRDEAIAKAQQGQQAQYARTANSRSVGTPGRPEGW